MASVQTIKKTVLGTAIISGVAAPQVTASVNERSGLNFMQELVNNNTLVSHTTGQCCETLQQPAWMTNTQEALYSLLDELYLYIYHRL